MAASFIDNAERTGLSAGWFSYFVEPPSSGLFLDALSHHQ